MTGAVGAISPERPKAGAYPSGGLAFDAGAIVCLTWLLLGGYTDGWAHNNLSGLDTFFTPWHAVLYSGFAVSALYLVVAAVRWHADGYAWNRALPRGYEWSLIGAGIFAVGGALDMLWHVAFGIEADVAALVSPTHLTLLCGASLLYLGPLRAALARGEEGRGAAALPALLSAVYFWCACTFFTQYASPFGDTFSAAAFPHGLVQHEGAVLEYFTQALAVCALLLQTGLMMGVLLFVAARLRLPAGAFALALTVQAALMTAMRYDDIKTGVLPVIAAALVAGAICDVVYARLRPTPQKRYEWLLFAAAVPFVVFALYFATVTALAGTWWPVHLLFGAPVEAAGIGWLVGWLTLRE